MSTGEVYVDRGYKAGIPIEEYKLSDEIIALIHLVQAQAVPIGNTIGDWKWEVRSCRSQWCVTVPGGADEAEWRRCLGAFVDAQLAPQQLEFVK